MHSAREGTFHEMANRGIFLVALIVCNRILCAPERQRGRSGKVGGEGRLKVTYLIWPGPNQINLKPLWHIEHMAVVGEEIFFRYTPAVALIQQHVLPMRAAVR